MFKNYIKTAWRSVKRYKTYSLINIFGLSLGIASCLIIFLVVTYELSYDRFNKKADRIYRVTLNAIDFNPSVSMAIAPAMRNYFPELEQVSQVWHQNGGLITINNTRYNEKSYMFADEHFAKIFDYEWISGNPNKALSDPNEIVLTETMAKKYFGNKNAMGQIITLENQYPLKVSGIIKDVPGNTTLPFTFLVSFKTIEPEVQGMMHEFYAIAGSNTFILAPEHFDIEKIHKRIPAFIEANWGKEIAKDARLPLQPLTEIHFDQRYLNSDITPTTSKQSYWALAAVAVLIIVIASINFINLATAQSIKRSKEIGVRKVLGSNRFQLMFQFMSETTLMVLFAIAIGLLASYLFLPLAGEWLNIKISTQVLGHWSTLLVIVLIAISLILLAGLYPALLQSGFSPIRSLKKETASNISGFNLRKLLVIVQFAISQIMIAGTLVVAFQMDFFKNRDLGFNKDNVISIPIPDHKKIDVLRQSLNNNPGVKQISFASGAPGYNTQYCDFSAPALGMDKGDVTELIAIDENYTDMFKLHMLAGQKIIRKGEKDSSGQIVVNETFLAKIHMADPKAALGQRININGGSATIIGVVQDFQSESKHKKRRACALYYNANNFFRVCIKLQEAGMNQTIAGIDKMYSAMFPKELFQYEFLDEHIAKWYRQEEKEYTAFKLFACVAILIGCLGLYGLVAFAASQRIKEVGVRKVLGASLGDIVFLFSKEFIVLILIAFLIAVPLTYYAMNSWLQNFAYHININFGIFVIAIVASFLIAGITIAYQALRAAVVSPVKSLRLE